MIRNEDIRWFDVVSGKRVTYIDTLKGELKQKNQWLYKAEWDAIEVLLEHITEENAKEQCFIIQEKIRARVDYDRHQYE